MATFSAIVSTEYAVGAPITNSWGSKVSNNVLAIIQGDATASSNRVQEAALSAALIAQLVTNGDSHNHSGGDGASIPNTSVTGLGALATLNSVTAAQVGAKAIQQSKLEDYSSGSYYNKYVTGSITSGSYTKINEVLSGRGGTVSTKILLRSGYIGVAAYARVYVNGVAIGTARSTTSQTDITYTENISVNAGDLVQLYSYGTSGATSSLFIGHSASTTHVDALVY